jgi:N utilization substance protein B
MTRTEEGRGPDDYRRERHFARQCALQFLYQADLQGDWGNVARNLAYLRRQVRDLDIIPEGVDSGRLWGFVDALVHGVCTKRFALDRLISEAATNWTIARMSAVDRNILRLAAYELCFGSHTPLVTAVDEGVELAKEYGHADSKRFVNGVLDRILHLRQKQDSADQPAPADEDPTPPDSADQPAPEDDAPTL